MTTLPEEMWVTRPEHLAGDTRERMERRWTESRNAIKYFRCEICGAARGEACKGDDTGVEEAWHAKWDAHGLRVSRWENATDLEMAMLKAILDDEVEGEKEQT